jgi:RNA polymerase sigma-70 factor, ECF subfamily
MNLSTSQHAPPKSIVDLRPDTAAPETEPATVAGEDRHAAVCAGAIEFLPDLRGFARSLTGNSHLADDLVQSTILRALSAAQTFTPGSNFKAWSFTILRNLFYNQWRSPASRHVMLDDCTVTMPTTAATQDASLELCDFRRAFAQLVPDQREALLLIGAAGLSYLEAAMVCNCAPGTIKSRVSRARSNLRAMMDSGELSLRRRDVMPISAVDLAFALETSIAACNLPTRAGRPQANLALRDLDDDAAPVGSGHADFESPTFLLRS